MSTLQQRFWNLCQEPLTNDATLKIILQELIQQDKRYLIDVEDETHRSALFHAIESGKSLDFIRELLLFPVRLTNRILLAAIRYGHIELLQLLKEFGADFRQKSFGLSLLHECILLHKNHFIRFLIDQGDIDPNVVDSDNQTPLLYAIFRTNIEAINILLSYPSVDPCQISTRTRELTCFHVACELGIDEILPSMFATSSPENINRLTTHDQTAFDLFLSCYLFTKNSLYLNEISLQNFSSLFDLFLRHGAKLHHLTKAYRRTRGPYVTKIFNLLWKKDFHLSSIILFTGRQTIFDDIQSIICQALGDWPYLLESNEKITRKLSETVLTELYELFLLTFYKSNNRQTINRKLLTRYCSANERSSAMKRILWIFLQTFIQNAKQPNSLKSIARKQILLHLKSLTAPRCSLEISKDLRNYLLFFAE